MITEEERIIRKSQGYDIGFEQNGKKYWINSNTWNERKEIRLFQETGLATFYVKDNICFYDPHYFEKRYFELVGEICLLYVGDRETNIPQPINMQNYSCMFVGTNHLKNLDLSDWDMSEATATTGMFMDSRELCNLNLSNWNLSKDKRLMSMFKNCQNLENLNLKNFKSPKGFFLGTIFDGCIKLQNRYKVFGSTELLNRIFLDTNEVKIRKLDAF